MTRACLEQTTTKSNSQPHFFKTNFQEGAQIQLYKIPNQDEGLKWIASVKFRKFLYEFFSYELVDFVVSPIWPLPTNVKGWVWDFVGLVTPHKLGGFLFKATTSMAYDFVRGTFLTATNSIQGQVCDSVGFFWDFNFDSVQNP